MKEATLRMLAAEAMKQPPFPDKRFPPSAYYRFLWQLAAYKKPWVSIELGVSGGGGSLHLAMGRPGHLVIGVDIARDHEENITYIEGTYPNFQFWCTDSILAADTYQQLIGRHRLVDILFVDTVHTLEQTMQEWYAWRDLLDPDACVCFDDLKRPGMDGAWAQIPDPKVRLDFLHTGAEHGGGFGVKFFD